MRSIQAAVACAVASVVFQGACASGNKDVKTDAMSKSQHQEQAAREEAEAAQHRAAYDPNATASRGGGVNAPDGDRNPTAVQLESAKVHERHAAQHRAAAAALQSFEDAMCIGVPAPARAACPFLGGSVDAVRNIPGGVKLVMAPGQNPDVLVRTLSCHAAFARAQHQTTVDDCAPYVPNVTVKKSADGLGVELTTPDVANAAELQKRAASQVVNPAVDAS